MDAVMMEDLADDVKRRWDWIASMDIKKPLNETSASERAQVVERLSKQGPPPQFRLIDCKATSEHNRVVLVDGHLHDSFTAVSHTWGQEVYGTFDCQCAAECHARVRRCSGTPCLGHDKRHREVIVDILKMCNLLMLSGSEFVWHDGVCIAQHDAEEVKETIRHMGWIYSKARDTVIFLDYVGRPRALVKEAKHLEEDTIDMPRWRSRVWTVQEALLTKRRRYCIRRCAMSNVPTTNHDNASGSLTREESLMAWISGCDEDDSFTAVVEEEEVWAELVSLYDLVSSALLEAPQEAESPALGSIFYCFCSLIAWLDYFKEHVFNFPSLKSVLRHCSNTRDSKHPGDRINSVLGLAGITDFVADKDKNVEHSTIEFMKRLGQKGLRDALFWVNHKCLEEFDGKVHTWLPCLSSVFEMIGHKDDGAPRAFDDVECEVLENDMLQLTGRLCCMPV